MEPQKRILSFIPGIALICILSACQITGADPDPGEIIYAVPGQTLSFQVYGPVPRTVGSSTLGMLTFFTYGWIVDTDTFLARDTRTLSYTIPEVTQATKIKITCRLLGYAPPLIDFIDSRTWTILVNQGSTPTWNGDYTLEDQTDLNILKDYTRITGNLYISNRCGLSDLKGLENLSSVGRLSIGYSEELLSLDGLEGLSSITGYVTYSNTVAPGEINIYGNEGLIDIKGLRNITSADGLYVANNSSLTSLGMDALARVNGDFEITNNTSLCTTMAEALRDQVVAGDGIDGTVTIEGNMDCSTP
jgi:hypothetical protein